MTTKITIELGDLTTCGAEAIVNPANTHLQNGAGAAGAIAGAAGPGFQAACDALVLDQGPLETGSSVTMPPFALGDKGVKSVICVVGPRCVRRAASQQDQTLLARCVQKAILTADQAGLKDIAIPAVSSGLFGFPKNLCAKILVATALSMLPRLKYLRFIRFVNNDEFTTDLFTRALADQRGGLAEVADA